LFVALVVAALFGGVTGAHLALRSAHQTSPLLHVASL
jgi:hypothetical protein